MFSRKILKYLSLYNLVSDCQYGFHKDRFIGDVAFLRSIKIRR